MIQIWLIILDRNDWQTFEGKSKNFIFYIYLLGVAKELPEFK